MEKMNSKIIGMVASIFFMQLATADPAKKAHPSEFGLDYNGSNGRSEYGVGHADAYLEVLESKCSGKRGLTIDAQRTWAIGKDSASYNLGQEAGHAEALADWGNSGPEGPSGWSSRGFCSYISEQYDDVWKAR